MTTFVQGFECLGASSGILTLNTFIEIFVASTLDLLLNDLGPTWFMHLGVGLHPPSYVQFSVSHPYSFQNYSRISSSYFSHFIHYNCWGDWIIQSTVGADSLDVVTLKDLMAGNPWRCIMYPPLILLSFNTWIGQKNKYAISLFDCVRTYLGAQKKSPSSRAENVNRPFTIKWSTRNELGKGDAYCNNYATVWNIDQGTESRTGGEPCFLHQFQVFLQKLFSTPPTTYSLQRRRTRFQVSRVKMSRREMCKCNDQQNYCTFGKMRFFPPNLLRRILCAESTQLRKHLRFRVM